MGRRGGIIQAPRIPPQAAIGMWNSAKIPDVPDDLDDEFPDGALLAGWVTWNPGGDFSIVGNDGYGGRFANDSAAFAWGGLHKALPSDNHIEFAIHASLGSIPEGISFNVGLLIGEDLVANPTTDDFYVNEILGDGGGFNRIALARFSDFNSFSATIQQINNWRMTHAYFLIQYDQTGGNNRMNAYYSSDGVEWSCYVENHTLTFNPQRIGFAVGSQANDVQASIEFFRITRRGADSIYGTRPPKLGGPV